MEARTNISVIDPVGHSTDWTKRVLFVGFRLEKWFVLGFCAFLADLGSGGGARFNFKMPFGNSGGGTGEMAEIKRWVMAHLALVIGVGVGLLLLGIAIGVLLLWLSSRGRFMFLDGVARNRAAVVEPWRRFRALANSLFAARFLLALVASVAVVLVILLCGLVAWPSFKAREFDASALVACLLAAMLMVPLVLTGVVIEYMLKDFIMPIMYRRGLRTLDAIAVFRQEILPGHTGAFILFYLMKLVLGIAGAVVAMLGTCVTCCIAGLPYISSVVFLPISVFMRSYPLFFLAQFGEEWRLIGDAPPQAPLQNDTQPI